MHATFRQLRLLIALSEHMSISGAARACHISQPAVSMQLKELADAVGLPLYEQIGKSIHLTEAGEAVVCSARAMAEEWSGLEQRIDAMKGLARGRLRLAVVSTAKYFAPRFLGSFCAAHPHIDISLEILNRDGVLARLRQNLDDLYIMSVPPTDVELERHSFLPNPLVVIAPANHASLGPGALPLSRLKEERFILRERGSGTRLACDGHFSQLGFTPSVRLELGSNEAIKHAVAAGMGLSVVSRHALSKVPLDEGLQVLDVEGFPLVTHWWIIFLRGKRLSPVASAFLDNLVANAKELHPT